IKVIENEDDNQIAIEDSDSEEINIKDARLLKLCEKEVGITEFLGDHRGFKADFKQRYSDFIVHEILNEGPAILTDLGENLIKLDKPEEKSEEKSVDQADSTHISDTTKA